MDTLMLPLLFLLAGSHLNLANPDCTNDESCDVIGQFEINVEVNGNEIYASWKLNYSETFYGFQTVIYKSDNSIRYKSPILHVSARSMTLEHDLDGKNMICVNVYKNVSTILVEKCEEIEMADLKIIIGILAGVVFLIPCIIGLSYVVYKDIKVTKLDEYDKLNSSSEEEKPKGTTDVNVIVKNMKVEANGGKNADECKYCKDNKAFVIEEGLNQILDTDKHAETAEKTSSQNTDKDKTSDIENGEIHEETLPHDNNDSAIGNEASVEVHSKLQVYDERL